MNSIQVPDARKFDYITHGEAAAISYCVAISKSLAGFLLGLVAFGQPGPLQSNDSEWVGK